MNEVTHQCGSCHEETASTYMQTYHGKAYQLGYYESARCSDCHGAHNVLKASNPASMTSEENLVNTCGSCHVGANKRFTGYLSHATHKDDPKLHGVYIFMTTLSGSIERFHANAGHLAGDGGQGFDIGNRLVHIFFQYFVNQHNDVGLVGSR